METLSHKQNRMSAATRACVRKSWMSFAKIRPVNQPLTKAAHL